MIGRLSRALVLALLAVGSCKSKPPESPDPTDAQPVSTTGHTAGEGDEPEPLDLGEVEPVVVSDAPCIGDDECVPAGCCHAASCTSRASAPSCDDVMCTQECRFGTLDCGGSCFCHEGLCAARLSLPPSE